MITFHLESKHEPLKTWEKVTYDAFRHITPNIFCDSKVLLIFSYLGYFLDFHQTFLEIALKFHTFVMRNIKGNGRR